MTSKVSKYYKLLTAKFMSFFTVHKNSAIYANYQIIINILQKLLLRIISFL